MILLDLFSGIGGFHLGLERAGFKFDKVMFSEIDKYAISVYKNHFKDAEYVGSVTDVQLPRGAADIITFGSPCQDFSLAGKRAGMDGERSSLISHAIRLITEVQPKFFIWENVKGAFSSNDGADFWGIIQAFANIGGYRLEWELLNTSWFLPQNRERIYLVGSLGEGSGRAIFPIGEDGGLAGESFGEEAGRGVRVQIQPARVASCLPRGYKNRVDENFVRVPEPTKQGYAEAGEGDSINFSQPSSKTRRGRVGVGVAQTLDTACNQGTLDTLHKMGGAKPRRSCIGAGRTPEVGTRDTSIRRLTPIECERLQGFPDSWTAIGRDGETISDTQRYKMCGNAVSVPVVQAVGKSILGAT